MISLGIARGESGPPCGEGKRWVRRSGWSGWWDPGYSAIKGMLVISHVNMGPGMGSPDYTGIEIHDRDGPHGNYRIVACSVTEADAVRYRDQITGEPK